MLRALRYGFAPSKALSEAVRTPAQSRGSFPPFAFAGGGSRKRNHEQTTAAGTTTAVEEEVVIALISDDEEEEQRQKIMKFAASRRVENNQQNSHPTINIDNEKLVEDRAPPAVGAIETPSSAAEEDAARNRIMAHATAVNTERGISNNSLLAQLHAERLARRGPMLTDSPIKRRPFSSTAAATAAGQQPLQTGNAPSTTESTSPPKLSILSYNLWFNEQLEVEARMQAISQIILTAVPNDLPDIICFQEVTPYIYSILSSKPWWRQYTARPTEREIDNSYFTVLLWKINLASSGGGSSGSRSANDAKYASLPFENSRMGRDLKAVTVAPHNLPICIATSHFESPTGRQQMNSAPRQEQCKESLLVLDSMGKDAMLIGDLNWNEKNDGNPPLPRGWVDAWAEMHPDDLGYTYDTETNGMIKRGPWKLQLRLDRAFFKSNLWKLISIDLVGRDALPGMRYEGKLVLPSDHFGMLVKLVAVFESQGRH